MITSSHLLIAIVLFAVVNIINYNRRLITDILCPECALSEADLKYKLQNASESRKIIRDPILSESLTLMPSDLKPALTTISPSHLSLATMSPTSHPTALIPQKCRKYHSKTLIDPKDMFKRNVTLLTSFPGAGNTWTRLLIEAAIGVPTGSIYAHDNELLTLFDVESRCGLRMCAIKGHPETLDRCGPYLCLRNETMEKKKCNKGLVDKFTRFLFIARAPMKSIFSEFQRLKTKKHDGTLVEITDFLRGAWKRISLILANQIHDDWDVKMYPLMRIHSPINFLVIKYENLVDTNLRENELSQVAPFLKFPPSAERVECAFSLAQFPQVKRQSAHTLEEWLGQDTAHMCNLWNRIQHFSRNMSYPDPWPDLKC